MMSLCVILLRIKLMRHLVNFVLSWGIDVCATAAVPLIFDPVSIEDIYETRPYYRVVLVDGSVSDNTGLETLRDCGVTTIILSDGGVEIQEDPRIDYRLNPITATTRSIDLLTVQSEHDRLLAIRRANDVPVVHISLAFDRRFRQKELQRKLFVNVLTASHTFVNSPAANKLADQLNVSKTRVVQTLQTREAKNNKEKRQGRRGKKKRSGNESQTDSADSSINYSGGTPHGEGSRQSTTSSTRSYDSDSSSSSYVAPLPEINHRVLKLVGTTRTHLDVFSQVECWYIMGKHRKSRMRYFTSIAAVCRNTVY